MRALIRNVTMQVVIDTNILCEAAKHFSLDHIAILTYMNQLRHSLVLDYEMQLLNEYERNVGSYQLYRKWYKEMKSNFQIEWADGHISSRIARELERRSLHEAPDHVVVALAMSTQRYIITEDSDFGKGDEIRAAEHVEVLEYLTNDLGIAVYDASEACDVLRQ